MAKLHDALKASGYEGHPLEVYLVRLLFCLFADDTGIFPKDGVHAYLDNAKEDGNDLPARINRLFEVLNLSPEERAKKTLLSDDLKQFGYVNGGLFKELLPTPDFNADMRKILLDCCDFDWSKISPAIFGAMFQGVMDKDKRREIGAHYTSEENILKLINPLFMDELRAEFENDKAYPQRLEKFHDKISQLKFLDPACGCGNFLIIAYRELRRLELDVLKMQVTSGQKLLDISHLLKVNVGQFYGIEYEDFPCEIARVGMWLMEHQMNQLVSKEFGVSYIRLPLKESAHITRGNALTTDWDNVIPKAELSYIMGNPPFVGGMMMSREQKADMINVFENVKGIGELDYVSAWYKKAVIHMKNTDIGAAFVSTNSISQGQQASTLWKPLIDEGVSINFAYRTFVWSNEAKGKAAVHCVIVGFSFARASSKIIFDGGLANTANEINSYLVDAPSIFIESRSKPLCPVPPMRFGSMPRDGGGFVLTDDEKDALIASEPLAEKWIRPYIGSYEFINNKSRWCLWLKEADPSEIRQCQIVMGKVESIRKFRTDSVAEGTRKFADTPTLFCQIAQPDVDYIAVPQVSSERRKYIPIGFLPATTIASNLLFLIPEATVYHFGILTSSVHNSWMRAVGGRLKSDYRYSKDIVYNNFPWADVTDDQKKKIETAAQGVLDARAKFPESSLADLYDPRTMPPELLQAHQALDKAVLKTYGFSSKEFTEANCVARLMERYQALTR
ncbi:MAG: N-6 DNA methylase [Zoogloeaceae bacterium]|nr:N-6 DNA methylase [Zoogloeaceae bacterium]